MFWPILIAVALAIIIAIIYTQLERKRKEHAAKAILKDPAAALLFGTDRPRSQSGDITPDVTDLDFDGD